MLDVTFPEKIFNKHDFLGKMLNNLLSNNFMFLFRGLS